MFTHDLLQKSECTVFSYTMYEAVLELEEIIVLGGLEYMYMTVLLVHMSQRILWHGESLC